MTLLRSVPAGVLDWLYPPKCCLCDAEFGEHLCSQCRDAFEPRERVVEEFAASDDLDYRVAPFAYTGRAAQAVRRFKYARSTALAAPLGSLLKEVVEGHGLLEGNTIVPVPIHWTRRCLRGFNQSELLAESFPAQIVKSKWLVRSRATRPQVGLAREERIRNLQGAFRASFAASGAHVLLLDDVVTSGHTAEECARALKTAGARRVGVLALCGG